MEINDNATDRMEHRDHGQALPPPIPDKTDLIVSVAERYTDHETGRVRWGQAQAENPDLFETLTEGGAIEMKALIDKYNYMRRKVVSNVKRPPGKKPKNKVWEANEVKAVMQLANRFKDKSTGTVRWSDSKEHPMMVDLLTRHTFNEVTSRWHYEINKGKYPKKKPAKPANKAPSPAPVAKPVQEMEPPASAVNFCPYCGHNIQAVIVADRITRRDR